MLAATYEQREERRKAQQKQKKERNEKKGKQKYIAEKWDKEREKKFRKEMIELQWDKQQISREEKACFSSGGIGNPSILADTYSGKRPAAPP